MCGRAVLQFSHSVTHNIIHSIHSYFNITLDKEITISQFLIPIFRLTVGDFQYLAGKISFKSNILKRVWYVIKRISNIIGICKMKQERCQKEASLLAGGRFYSWAGIHE